MIVDFPSLESKKKKDAEDAKRDCEFIEAVGAEDADAGMKALLAFSRKIGIQSDQITFYQPGEIRIRCA